MGAAAKGGTASPTTAARSACSEADVAGRAIIGLDAPVGARRPRALLEQRHRVGRRLDEILQSARRSPAQAPVGDLGAEPRAKPCQLSVHTRSSGTKAASDDRARAVAGARGIALELLALEAPTSGRLSRKTSHVRRGAARRRAGKA